MDFVGFFSYTHHDARTDPELVETFTTQLEDHVNAKLINATFKIWRDKQELKTGDRWDSALQDQVARSDILIVLLTPKWLGSRYCLKEFAVFEAVEKARGVDSCVAPILARKLESQLQFANEEQKNFYSRIQNRQFAQVLATDFLRLTSDERKALVEKLADDIEAMLSRLRTLPAILMPAVNDPSPAKGATAPVSERVSTDDLPAGKESTGPVRAPLGGDPVDTLRRVMSLILRTRKVTPVQARRYRLGLVRVIDETPELTAAFAALEELDKIIRATHDSATAEKEITAAIEQASSAFEKEQAAIEQAVVRTERLPPFDLKPGVILGPVSGVLEAISSNPRRALGSIFGILALTFALYPGRDLIVAGWWIATGKVTEVERSLCLAPSGAWGLTSQTEEAIVNYLAGRSVAPQAVPQPKLSDKSLRDALSLIIAKVPDCAAAGFLSAFEVGRFGPTSQVAGALTTFRQSLGRRLPGIPLETNSATPDPITRSAIEQYRLRYGLDLQSGNQIDPQLLAVLDPGKMRPEFDDIRWIVTQADAEQVSFAPSAVTKKILRIALGEVGVTAEANKQRVYQYWSPLPELRERSKITIDNLGAWGGMLISWIIKEAGLDPPWLGAALNSWPGFGAALPANRLEPGMIAIFEPLSVGGIVLRRLPNCTQVVAATMGGVAIVCIRQSPSASRNPG